MRSRNTCDHLGGENREASLAMICYIGESRVGIMRTGVNDTINEQ